MIKLNFTDHQAAQDMIRIIEQEKSLSIVEALDFAINDKNLKRILKTGWASIALDMWGHDDPERERETMGNPYVEIDLDESKLSSINDVAKKEKVDIETAVSYFLLFTVESLGYHI